MGNRFLFLIIHVLYMPLLVRANLWSVDIDEGPAPSPEDGPPFSANASRNPALLPAQICGIVGAYIGAAVIMGGLLLTVGRRMRRTAQSLTQLVISTEMVKPTLKMFDESPTSPYSQRSWYSPRRLKKKRSIPGSARSASNPGSPAVESIASFDPNIIEADKASRQQELEQLYAAALAQEAAKSKTTITESEVYSPTATSSKQRRPPPRLLTSAPALAHLNVHENQVSPISPRSPMRAIYPPDSPVLNFPSAASPAYAEYPTSHGPRSPAYSEYLTSHAPRSPRSPAYAEYPTSQGPRSPKRRARSPGATSTRTRTPSFGSQAETRHSRRSLRNLRIHNTALGRYPGEVSDEEVRTPLTPRYYTDPGIPPSPPPRSEAPTTPGTHDGYDAPVDVEEMDRIRAIPRAEPQRTNVYQYNGSEEAGANGKRPTGLQLNTNMSANVNRISPYASASTFGTLPFRALSHSAEQPLASPGFPTKVTYLERRRDVLGGLRSGMATPYSPYMPFTPVTPVTPHLTSRAERKQREKEQRRRALGEEDRVIEEDEMWGNGF